MRTLYKHLHFSECPGRPAGHQEYTCYSNNPECALGYVVWYAPWRAYVFEPEIGTQFSDDCMESIIHFIKQLAK